MLANLLASVFYLWRFSPGNWLGYNAFADGFFYSDIRKNDFDTSTSTFVVTAGLFGLLRNRQVMLFVYAFDTVIISLLHTYCGQVPFAFEVGLKK